MKSEACARQQDSQDATHARFRQPRNPLAFDTDSAAPAEWNAFRRRRIAAQPDPGDLGSTWLTLLGHTGDGLRPLDFF